MGSWATREGLPGDFPPSRPGAWRSLDSEGRRLWLACAQERALHGRHGGLVPSAERGRSVTVDGRLVDDLLAFWCAIGEAVNGPGGYFGRSLPGFDDCLFGGFGLELPYTIVWEHADSSRRALGSDVLLAWLADEEGDEGLVPMSERTPEEVARHAATKEASRRGEHTMFDLIVEAIESVSARARRPGAASLVLR